MFTLKTPDNIRDTTQSLSQDGSVVIIGQVNLIGNKVTRDKIIYREIEFKPGDTLTRSELDQRKRSSTSNLINRSIFNFVTFEEINNEGVTDIDVEVTERWYIWPIPIINTAEPKFECLVGGAGFWPVELWG